MDRPFLVVLRDLFIQDGVDRLLDDRRLEERARVQTDDAGAVVHRIEVIVLRFLVNRMRAPEGDVLVAGEIDLLPLLWPRGMRPDEDANVLQPRIAARPDGFD